MRICGLIELEGASFHGLVVNMNRRKFLQRSVVIGIGVGAAARIAGYSGQQSNEIRTPAYSVIPVVGDGKWVWTEPPKDEKGYLEPRKFETSIGIQLEGKGNARGIKATTPVPVDLPEQKIDDVRIETQGCQAQLRRLTDESSQLICYAPAIAKGQTVGAVAHISMTLFKQYQAFTVEQFPAEQKLPRRFPIMYSIDSPGIQTRHPSVRKLAAEVGGQFDHPWDKARAFHAWVWKNIRAQTQYYTSVLIAIRDRTGDCEERAAIFVALCRATGIPARLVWIPNHNWAEFYENST